MQHLLYSINLYITGDQISLIKLVMIPCLWYLVMIIFTALLESCLHFNCLCFSSFLCFVCTFALIFIVNLLPLLYFLMTFFHTNIVALSITSDTECQFFHLQKKNMNILLPSSRSMRQVCLSNQFTLIKQVTLDCKSLNLLLLSSN